MKIVELFEIDITIIYSKILNDDKYETQLRKVLEIIKAAQSDNELDIAA